MNNFYQSKFDYFRRVSFLSAMLTGLLEITYFISDCQIFGRFAYETLVPRCSVILPLLLLIICEPRIKNYRFGVFLYYLIAHASMWATIWAIWFLPNKDFAREGFIIMHFAFLAIGLGMPVAYHVPIHSLVLLNIIISNTWNHYEHFDMMISLAVPVFIGIIIIMLILENSYADQYLIKRELEKTSITDNLTEAYNRNKINEIVSDDETEQLNIPHAVDVVVLMIDIDKFKRVNDTYGHDAGDKILVFLTEQIKRCIRSSDMLIRWGGEEFVVLLVGAETEVGLKIAEHIRHSVETTENEVCPITISVGVSKYDGGNYREAVKKADRALYYAKGHGRNLVVHYDDISDEDLLDYPKSE
ncbi:GGDEF domain-containing protein [Butyrivibrio sp. WCD3002]|uniref:GGDEF domain-containing protein n=1 Tax=Butyrivibrio sp. WCD3002 TaxID=1280676 RepID=UPI0018C97FB1|nr:GGDEF domain-containing protein [Butyrivibrio sp. WCD3002]